MTTPFAGERQPATRRITALLSASLVVVALGASAHTVAVQPLAAAAAPPGTSGTELFLEDFDTGADASVVQRLSDYVGSGGEQYSSASQWQHRCSGWIASAQQNPTATAQVANCLSGRHWNAAQRLALALGEYGQAANPAANAALSAYTVVNPGANRVLFETATPLPIPVTERFIGASVDVAAVQCSDAGPQLLFSVLHDAGAATQLGGVLDSCAGAVYRPPQVGVAPSGGEVRVATLTTTTAALLTSSALGLRISNGNGSATGNDAALDNIRLLDLTPTLSQRFTPAVLPVNAVSTLTVEVANTAELARKQGWSFQHTLPTGVTVADGTATTTCSNATLTAALGAASFAMTGTLASGDASCLVHVPVTAAAAGSYSSGSSSFALRGLDAPAAATLTFEPATAALTVALYANDMAYSMLSTGQSITYSIQVANPGTVPLRDVQASIEDFSGLGSAPTVQCPSGIALLLPGESVECSATYQPVAADSDDFLDVSMTVVAAGLDPDGQPVTAASSTLLLPRGSAPVATLAVTVTGEIARNDRVGEAAQFAFTVRNTSAVTLTDITLRAGTVTGGTPLSDFTCPAAAAALASTEAVTCSATTTVTQAGLDQGRVTAIADATARSIVGGYVPVSFEEQGQVTLAAVGAATVRHAAHAVQPRENEQVRYDVVITNTGAITMNPVQVQFFEFSGYDAPSAVSCPALPAGLAPGESVTCTAEYQLHEDDLERGRLRSRVQVAAPSVGNAAQLWIRSGEAVVELPEQRGLTLAHISAMGGPIVAGQTITYDFRVRNFGNLGVSGVNVRPIEFSGTNTFGPLICSNGAAMPVDGIVSCSLTYVPSAEDAARGELILTARAEAVSLRGTAVTSPQVTVTRPLASEASLLIEKVADVDEVSVEQQEILYTFTITNVGLLTLTGASVVDDDFTGAGTLGDINCTGDGRLAYGQQMQCTATYAVTAADLAAETIQNTAVAVASHGGGQIESPASSVTVRSTGKAAARDDLLDTGTDVTPLVVLGTALLVFGTMLALELSGRRRRA